MSDAHTYSISEGHATVVVGDTQTAFAAVDDALFSNSRLLGSIIETTKASNLPVGISQRLFMSMTLSAHDILSGRAKMVSALALMEQIRDRSNVKELADGCTRPWVYFGNETGTMKAVDPVVAS